MGDEMAQKPKEIIYFPTNPRLLSLARASRVSEHSSLARVGREEKGKFMLHTR